MKHPELAAGRVQSWGVQIIDLPSGAAVGCAAAYRRYRERRRQRTETVAPLVPLPDFFIGAHAQLAGGPWTPATRIVSAPTSPRSFS